MTGRKKVQVNASKILLNIPEEILEHFQEKADRLGIPRAALLIQALDEMMALEKEMNRLELSKITLATKALKERE